LTIVSANLIDKINFCRIYRQNLTLKVFIDLGSCYLLLLSSDISAQTSITGISYCLVLHYQDPRVLKTWKICITGEGGIKDISKGKLWLKLFCQDSFYWYT